MSGSGLRRTTRILPVQDLNAPLPHNAPDTDEYLAARWRDAAAKGTPSAKALQAAAHALRTTDTPVAFPTETVYGLGADATRSPAVRGIYAAKQRPSDNPLIVHVCSRAHLLRLLAGPASSKPASIPPIYEPLIRRFWPGPLTILLPIPSPNPFAPEVTSTLQTFGVRTPSSALARLLIYVADRPLAAPSANASTRPSPTTAQHVLSDMDGRIDMILDGGPCGVGVESTVVDGLSDPPAILRPGGIGEREIRAVPGWENVVIGYQDKASLGLPGDSVAPRAPGMKYKHYSPRARVVLYRAGTPAEVVARRVLEDVQAGCADARKFVAGVGIVRTQHWPEGITLPVTRCTADEQRGAEKQAEDTRITVTDFSLPLSSPPDAPESQHRGSVRVSDVGIGPDTESVARGLFFALRALDEQGVATIHVEGVAEDSGDLAQAVMNRLRKAAEEEVVDGV
ncbi:hypothetical protein KEM52_006098 [Ascosphaera acerosa]|nr:hypothetical protein KEM52_006098 [Ascosphaera acerosa]